MTDNVRFTVFDPRIGTQFDMKFGRKKIFRSAEHQWVILQAQVKWDRENSMASFLSSFIMRMLATYCEEELLIQHGPPIYEEQKASLFPKNWRLVIERRDSRVFHVPRSHFSDFEGYFRSASSYEQWMFFFVNSNSLTSPATYKPEFINMELFLFPPFSWKGLIHIEGDFGQVLGFLPFTAATNQLVNTLVQEGIATPAPRSLTWN